MFHRWAALLFVLAFCAMSPKNAAGQQSKLPQGRSAGRLGPNYPNPFNPDTKLPFSVGDSTCVAGSGQHVVTMQLLNILGLTVAYPSMFGPAATSTTSIPSSLRGPVHDMVLACGDYEAIWRGKDANGREAASGVYIELVTIDGFRLPPRRIYYKK